jgi:hypothetical protein
MMEKIRILIADDHLLFRFPDLLYHNLERCDQLRTHLLQPTGRL